MVEFLRFLRQRKKLWMVPVLAWLALITALIALAEGTALGPAIYSLF